MRGSGGAGKGALTPEEEDAERLLKRMSSKKVQGSRRPRSHKPQSPGGPTALLPQTLKLDNPGGMAGAWAPHPDSQQPRPTSLAVCVSSRARTLVDGWNVFISL